MTTPETAVEVFELTHAKELDAFETEFVQACLPSEYADRQRQWQTRRPLSELIKPPKFHGRLADIVVVPMDEAFEALATRGHNMTGNLSSNIDHRRAHTVGFRVLADMYSTGRGVLGAINTGVWVWQRTDVDDPTRGQRAHYGEYGRFVEKAAKPLQLTVEYLLRDSTAIGLTLERHAVRNPYRGGFESARYSKGR